MTPIHARASRPILLQRRALWRRVATALLLAAGWAALIGCGGGEPTAAPSQHSVAVAANVATAAKPDHSLIAYVSSARGGVSQMSPMKADG